jgi:demethylmenaquinone methyltransferase/2-methoxy-6-polyprenyl-1,4-benzoquinol methylase
MILDQVREVIYTKEGAELKYDSTSHCYHLIMGVYEIKPNMEALKFADIKRDEKILDVGFGTGWVLEKMIEFINPLQKIHGIDFAKGMIRSTIDRLKKKQLYQRVILVKGNAISLPYKNESFDVVFASFILDLQKIMDIQKLLQELKRVLKPTGRAVIVAMTKEGKGLKKLTRCFYDWFYPFWPTIFGYRASSRPIYINKEIEKAEFIIIREKLSHIVFFNFPIKIIVCKK